MSTPINRPRAVESAPLAETPRPARLAREIRGVPMRVILPNLVTLLALSLGLFAIRFAIEGRYETAVICIVAAAIFDGLDGRLARAIAGTSRFGAELDSLADFVDFGVAPALLLYVWILHDIRSLGWFAAPVFAIACALRLARFTVAVDDPKKPDWAANFFTGMPAPAGALTGLLPAYLHLLGLPVTHLSTGLEIAYLLVIAFLMASRIPHFSGKDVGRVPRDKLIVVMFGVAVLLLLLVTYPMEVLVALTLVYLALIPFAVRSHAACERRDAAAAPPAES